MAAISSSVSAFAGKAVCQAPQIRAKAPKAVAIRASAQNDAASKAVSLFAAGAVALSASPALALNNIELTDKRVEQVSGLQLIYEARDLDLDNKTRNDGPSRFALQKLTTEQTAARASESVDRLNKDVAVYVGKKYWTQASNELRRQVYTLRFDLNNLVEAKGGSQADAKKFYKTLESLDFSIRQKDQESATALLGEVQSQASALIKALA
jgi:photosystem II oxygen-evolving enhancer protein 3